jgi:hypothetical protein
MKNRNTILIAALSAVACFALPAQTRAACDSPDQGCAGGNLAEGYLGLGSLSGGFYNTGIGTYSLLSLTDASLDTAVGAGALFSDNAGSNTAVGAAALFSNTTGSFNTAFGTFALFTNGDGSENNAVGYNALLSNVSGSFNNAHGRGALTNNTASENNAFGDLAMESNTTGASNTAIGDDALRFNVDGSGNVAVGDEAGTGLGVSVNNCIAINVNGAGPFAVLDNTCFISRLATLALKKQCLSINLTWWASPRHPGSSNTTFNRWRKPAKPFCRLSR